VQRKLGGAARRAPRGVRRASLCPQPCFCDGRAASASASPTAALPPFRVGTYQVAPPAPPDLATEVVFRVGNLILLARPIAPTLPGGIKHPAHKSPLFHCSPDALLSMLKSPRQLAGLAGP
jgi:hypothetical protein